jgi:pyridoxal phosphate enzyme (YggS family)
MQEISFNDKVKEIQSNLERVQDKITAAAHKACRNVWTVKLVAVTKKQSVETIKAAIAAGITCFGENYAEEAVEKLRKLNHGNAFEWHMIGHIQSRKAAIVCEYFDYVHSVDRMKIAQYLNRYAGERGITLPVLIEVNLSGEKSKFGWQAFNQQQWPDIVQEFEKLGDMKNIQVKGLMTMPPLFDDPEQARPIYQKLKRFQEYLSKNLPELMWEELSIGTSFDYEIAIEEGATMVRIGTEIFGERENLR